MSRADPCSDPITDNPPSSSGSRRTSDSIASPTEDVSDANACIDLLDFLHETQAKANAHAISAPKFGTRLPAITEAAETGGAQEDAPACVPDTAHQPVEAAVNAAPLLPPSSDVAVVPSQEPIANDVFVEVPIETPVVVPAPTARDAHLRRLRENRASRREKQRAFEEAQMVPVVLA